MADDADDWFASADDDPPPPEPGSLLKRLSSSASVVAGDLAAKAAEDEASAADAAAAQEQVPEAEAEFLDPDRLMLCKHWIRPKFLQYKYLYDYRTNYYNDVIDFLDKRQRGLSREIPRPQTWAESNFCCCSFCCCLCYGS